MAHIMNATALPFRPIHYLGSKLRLVDVIRSTLDTVDPSGGPVCDLFAGSGTVSYALSQDRDVTAVDIQEYSRVLCSALLVSNKSTPNQWDAVLVSAKSSDRSQQLKNALAPLIEHEAHCYKRALKGDLESYCHIIENGSIQAFEQSNTGIDDAQLCKALRESISRLKAVDLWNSSDALTSRHFGGTYFSYHQASQLDCILHSVFSIERENRDLYLAAVLSTASEIVNTVGKQFAQPIRPRTKLGAPKPSLMRQIDRDRSTDAIDIFGSWLERYQAIPAPGHHNNVLRQDSLEALKSFNGDISAVYADPPYTRDHYSRYYHVLETLCLRDNPDISTVCFHGEKRLSRGLYRKDRHQSPFSIKSQAPRVFHELFMGVKRLGVPLVLSYSPYSKAAGAHPRMMTIQAIESLAQDIFRNVSIKPVGEFAHSKLNKPELNLSVSSNAEVLIVCTP